MTNQKSIAVLPFENLSADQENDFLADGITEEIINALAKIQGLKVTARTSSFSYKGKRIDVRLIGNELGVSTVLEGSIRRVGHRVRISAHLTRTDNGFHIWSENFDREMEDIFLLQDEIALDIADRIRENYGHLEIAKHLAKPSTVSIHAYELYLKGRYNHLKWDWEGLQNALMYYGESIAADPNFALPHFGLSYCYSMIGSWAKRPDLLDLSADHIEKGFALDAESDLGYFAKGTLEFWGHWNFLEGEKAYLKAFELNPVNSEAMEGLAELYIAIGHFEQADELTARALKVNPISANHLFTMGNIHYQQGRSEQGLNYFNSGLRVDPKFLHSLFYKALALIDLGELEKLAIHVEGVESPIHRRACELLGAIVNAPTVSPDMKREIAEFLPTIEDTGLVGWELYLLTHSGDTEAGLDLLEQVVENKEGQYVNFVHLPLLEPLRHSPRFKQLAAEMLSADRIPKIAGSSTKKREVKKVQIDPEEIRSIGEALDQLFEDGVYLDPGLSLRGLASQIGINPNKLSWYLNDQVGKNFSEFVNQSRVTEFQKRAIDPAYGHLSLLGLAYECGFNSKSVFNDYFKKSVGETPSKWVKLHST